MSKQRDKQAEIESAKERLKGFIKRPINYHNPERLARYREGRENAPHGLSWADLARNIRRW